MGGFVAGFGHVAWAKGLAGEATEAGEIGSTKTLQGTDALLPGWRLYFLIATLPLLLFIQSFPIKFHPAN